MGKQILIRNLMYLIGGLILSVVLFYSSAVFFIITMALLLGTVLLFKDFSEVLSVYAGDKEGKFNIKFVFLSFVHSLAGSIIGFSIIPNLF